MNLGALLLLGAAGAAAAKLLPATVRIVSQIYEPAGVGWGYPVVEHIFSGRSWKEAEGYFASHRKSDAFFNDCIACGCFAGDVECVERSHREIFRGGQWVRVGEPAYQGVR